MESLKNIFTRRSVRYFDIKEVEKEKIDIILRAAMSGPSAVNKRPWQFIVIKNKDILNKMATGNGMAAEPLRRCNFAILVCGDLSLAYENAPDYWAIDCTIATENMILAANDLGIGSVWLGTYPQNEKVANQKAIFNLPEHIVPHSIVAFGYPSQGIQSSERDLYEASKVHFEKY